METNEKMPISFQMALAHNKDALNTFLNMSTKAQENIINEAKKQKTVREINIFVASLGKRVE